MCKGEDGNREEQQRREGKKRQKETGLGCTPIIPAPWETEPGGTGFEKSGTRVTLNRAESREGERSQASTMALLVILLLRKTGKRMLSLKPIWAIQQNSFSKKRERPKVEEKEGSKKT